ncbi:MAG: efflux RND transporter periplasmic adaptor subunit [Solirubrobacteraceae bacterium]
MRERSPRPWPVYLLGALCVGAIVAAVLVVGPPSQSVAAQSRLVKVQRGVVQSTVSGSGNIQAATQLDLGFKTSGVVTHIYVAAGAHVTEGQLLAELNPSSAEVTLEQARASLQAAAASLVQEEETDGEPSSGSDSSPSGSGSGSTGSNRAGGRESSSTTTPKATLSPALREANIASARAAVKSDRLTVQSAEEALADTKLFAPMTGTVVSLSGEVGEAVSATGTTRSSSASSASSESGSGSSSARGAGAAVGAGSSSAGSSSSSGSGSSSSSFAVLSDLSSMQLVVPLSESEVLDVRDGQPATVTVEALEGLKLAAHVLSVATLPTTNSGVVSYDVTFQLDQLASGLKPGMSATAEVVVKQAEGVNVPTRALSGGSVTVVHDGKQERRRVVTGLAGNSTTLILSGLAAGEEIALPVASAGGAASLTSRLAGRFGGGGLGGGGLGGGGGGGVFFRGGG